MNLIRKKNKGFSGNKLSDKEEKKEEDYGEDNITVMNAPESPAKLERKPIENASAVHVLVFNIIEYH